MKRNDKVVVVAGEAPFIGMIGTLSQCFPKSVWDDPNIPEYMVDFPPIEDENGELVQATGLFFTAEEIEKV